MRTPGSDQDGRVFAERPTSFRRLLLLRFVLLGLGRWKGWWLGQLIALAN